LPYPISETLTLPASRLSLPVLVAEPSSIPAPVANASRLLPRGRDARHVDSAASSSLPVLASAVAAANLTLSKLPDGRTPMLCAYAACRRARQRRLPTPRPARPSPLHGEMAAAGPAMMPLLPPQSSVVLRGFIGHIIPRRVHNSRSGTGMGANPSPRAETGMGTGRFSSTGE